MTLKKKLLEQLHAGGITTLDFRRLTGSCNPADIAMKLESDLIPQGYDLARKRVTQTDEYGRPHRGIARYSLRKIPKEKDGQVPLPLD